MAAAFGSLVRANHTAAESFQTTALTCLAGDLLVLAVNVRWGGDVTRAIASVTDLGGNTYYLAKYDRAYRNNTTSMQWVYYAYNVGAYTSNRQTVTWDGTTAACATVHARFTGVRTTSDPLIGAESVNGSGTAELTTGAVNFPSSGILVGAGTGYTYGTNWTPGSGFTEHCDSANDIHLMMMSRVVSSSGNNSATATVSNTTNSYLLAGIGFYDDAPVGGSLPPSRPRSKHLLIR